MRSKHQTAWIPAFAGTTLEPEPFAAAYFTLSSAQPAAKNL